MVFTYVVCNVLFAKQRFAKSFLILFVSPFCSSLRLRFFVHLQQAPCVHCVQCTYKCLPSNIPNKIAYYFAVTKEFHLIHFPNVILLFVQMFSHSTKVRLPSILYHLFFCIKIERIQLYSEQWRLDNGIKNKIYLRLH